MSVQMENASKQMCLVGMNGYLHLHKHNFRYSHLHGHDPSVWIENVSTQMDIHISKEQYSKEQYFAWTGPCICMDTTIFPQGNFLRTL